LSTIRLTHAPSGTILAEGPKGFGGITPFEGNFYIRRKYLRTDALKVNGVPGLCPSKFLYMWPGPEARRPGAHKVSRMALLATEPAPALHLVEGRPTGESPGGTGGGVGELARRQHVRDLPWTNGQAPSIISPYSLPARTRAP
jgi:hypothetical protein